MIPRPKPKGEYTEMARYYSGLSYYNDSPDPRLDQSITYKGIEELQMYLDYYPRGEKVKEAQDMIVKLQEKLVEKEFLNAMTYFNIGKTPVVSSEVVSCRVVVLSHKMAECQQIKRFFPFIGTLKDGD